VQQCNRQTRFGLIILPAFLSSCLNDHPLAPTASRSGHATIPASETRETGCAQYEVHIHGDEIRISDRSPESCGTVRPVVVGVPVFDRVSGIARLQIALENVTSQPVRAPARLVGFNDSLAVLAPRGLATNKHQPNYVQFLQPDSLLDESGESVSLWSYLDRMTAEQDQVIPPRSRSSERGIRISVHPGVQHFRVVFGAAATRLGGSVPATAPDTVPGDLYGNPANILVGSPYFPLAQHVLRNIISLRFAEGTPQHTRQQLVDLVEGEVIGGQRFPHIEGYYLVRVPDDATGAGMYAAMQVLNTDVNVDAAEPEYLHLPETLLTYRQPADTDDWAGEWQVDSRRADGRNWALEAVSAPLAWGCETGDRKTGIALLDVGYMSHPDIDPNVAFSQFPDRYRHWYYGRNTHGTLTSSIIAASGDNRRGITGMMWQAGLHQYEISITHGGSDSSTIGWARWWRPGRVPVPLVKMFEYRLAEALERDVSVVNVSLALNANPVNRTLSPEGRVAAVEMRARQVAKIIRSARRKPLIVFGAGNQPRDAFWSTYPVIAALVPDQVLVVAGVNSVGDGIASLWPFSSINSDDPLIPYDLVEIAAPAVAVGALDDSGIQLVDGTSMAAPLVSGAAGLLKSFDPTLTAPEIKAILLEGARRAGRRVWAITGRAVFVLDAYESLKVAAERVGAPLCGNRIWTEDGKVYAERTGAAGGRGELLRDLGVDVTHVNAWHGGKDLRVWTPARGWESFAWRPTGWTSTPLEWWHWYLPGSNASLQSAAGVPHGGGLVGEAYTWANPDGMAVLAIRRGSEWIVEVPLRQMQQTAHSQCLSQWVQSTSCGTYGQALSGDFIRGNKVAHSTTGDSMLVAVSYGWSSVSYGATYKVEDHIVSSMKVVQESRHTDFYWVDLSARTVRQVWTEPSGSVAQIALSEQDREIMVRRLQSRDEFEFFGNQAAFTTKSQNTCDITYRSTIGGNILATPVPNCSAYSFAGFSS
jgi:subtilisin family serine protease